MYKYKYNLCVKGREHIVFCHFNFREHLKHQLKLNFKLFTHLFEMFGMFSTLIAH